MSESGRHRLAKLFRLLFSAEELRRFVHEIPGAGPEIYDALPGAAVSPTELAFQVAVELDRDNLINAALFSRLITLRPGRSEDINAVHARFLAALGEGTIDNPFPGLAHFEARQAHLYCGREADVARALQLLSSPHCRWLHIHAPSGVGKSSFLHAGLLPQIGAGAIAGAPRRLALAILRPGHHPVLSLADALYKALSSLENATQDAMPGLHVLEEILAKPSGLAGCIRQYIPGGGMVLILDQLEELFTQAIHDADRNAFAQGIAYAFEDDCPFLLVTAVRSDFVGRLSDLAGLRKLIKDPRTATFPLLSMDVEGLRQAMEIPAQRAGRTFEPGLVNQILRDVGMFSDTGDSDQPGVARGDGTQSPPAALPLIAHVLRALWESCEGQAYLSAAAYIRLGGVTGALTREADQVLRELDEPAREHARTLLLALVQLTQNSVPTRRTLSLDQAITIAGGNENSSGKHAQSDQHGTLSRSHGPSPGQQLLAYLAGSRRTGAERGPSIRLITVDADRVDLIHEVLLREWDTLRRWIAEERHEIIRRDDLRARFEAWKRAGASLGNLPRGADLAYLAMVKPVDLDPETREFMRMARRRHSRALWIRRGAMALLVAAVIGVSLMARYAFRQQDAAETARRLEQGRLATALAQEPGREVEALVLAIQTVGSTPGGPRKASPIAYHALSEALRKSRLITVLEGHSIDTLSVAFSPDGQKVLTGSSDRSARLWDLRTGKTIFELKGHEGDVTNALFAPDGSVIATIGGDGRVGFWDPSTGAKRALVDASREYLTAMAFSPDGSRLVSCGHDGAVWLWDTRAASKLRRFEGHTGLVHSVAYSRDGAQIATGGQDSQVFIWDKHGHVEKQIRDYKGVINFVQFSREGDMLAVGGDHGLMIFDTYDNFTKLHSFMDRRIEGADFSPDGERIAVAYGDARMVTIYDTVNGRESKTMMGHLKSVRNAVFSPDGTTIASVSFDGTARLWDAYTGVAIAVLKGHKGPLIDGRFSPGGDTFLTVGYDETVHVWDAHRIRASAGFQPHSGNNFHLLYLPDTNELLTAGGEGSVGRWNAATGKPAAPMMEKTLPQFGPVCFSPNGTRLVVEGDTNVFLIDPLHREVIAELAGGGISAIEFSPDSSLLVTGHRGPLLRLWDAGTGSLRKTYEASSPLGSMWDSNSNVAFSVDGGRFASGHEDGVVRVWDLATDEPIELEEHAEVNVVSFSPDGKMIASGGDSRAIVWDLSERKYLARFEACTDLISELSVYAVSFSSDGLRLVSGCSDGTVRLWDLRTGQRVAELPGHEETVSHAEFSPGDAFIATVDTGGVARLWDGSSGAILAVIERHVGWVNELAFSADNNHLATSDISGNLFIHDLDIEDLLGRACLSLSRLKEVEQVSSTCSRWIAQAR